MATKKKPAKSKTNSKPKAAAKATNRLAVKLLATLPPLSDVQRRAYRAAYTEPQCEDWGAKTKAVNVLADAERAVGAIQTAVKRGVDGYSARRLAWLCSQMVELEDAIDRQTSEDGFGARAGRNAAVLLATHIRQKLAHGLMSAAAGNADLHKEIAYRNESTETAAALETSITGLLQLALSLRRTPEGEVLADDAGLTQDFLSGASAVVDSLRASNDATYGTGRKSDTAETNRVEGRVLREVNFARVCLEQARRRGVVTPKFPELITLKSFVKGSSAVEHVPTPAPDSAPTAPN